MELLNLTVMDVPESFGLPELSLLYAENAVIFGGEYAVTVIVVLAVAVLPLESVTVVLIVNVPLLDITPALNEAEVNVFPSKVVFLDLIVAPCIVVSFNLTERLDCP
jgi:hypothetical protein